MKRVLLTAFGIMATMILVSPMLLYWWGLSVMNNDPAPSSQVLTMEQEREVWSKAREVGNPRVRSVNPYSYLFYLKCSFEYGVDHIECLERFPGLRVGAFAVRAQVAQALQDRGHGSWPISWMAYTIWVSRNWDIHQILATCYVYSQPRT